MGFPVVSFHESFLIISKCRSIHLGRIYMCQGDYDYLSINSLIYVLKTLQILSTFSFD